MSSVISIKEGQEPRSVFAIHHVNDEKDFRVAQIIFNRAPLVVSKRSAKIVSRNAQIKTMLPANLALGVTQRREQAGTYIKDGNLHRALNTNSLFISNLYLKKTQTRVSSHAV